MSQPHSSANYAGGTHYVNPKSGSAVQNNGGTLFYGGTLAANSPITVSMGITSLGFQSHASDHKALLSNDQNTGTNKPYSAGTFNNMVAGQYILFGYSKKVAGQSNTILQVGGSMGMRVSQPYATSFIRTSHYVLTDINGPQSGWNYVTGMPVTSPPMTTTDTVNAEQYKGTFLVPGRLFYLSTGKTATSKSYAAKTD